MTGASGFIGGHVCRRLRAAGYEVVGLVRRAEALSEARRLPGVVYRSADLTAPETLTGDLFEGVDAVVHLVGIIAEARGQGQTFHAVHVQATANLLSALAASLPTVSRFVYVSAIGASARSRSEYARTKAEAERLVTASEISATIFRPSLVLGEGSEFLPQIEALLRRPPLSPVPLPFAPVPGNGRTRFQPVFVEDLAEAIVRALREPIAVGKTYEIGGAETVSFDELVRAVGERIGVRKRLLHVPLPLLFAGAAVLEALLPRPPLTVDQLFNLRVDNVAENGPLRAELGVEPISFSEALDRVYGNDALPA